MPTVLKVIHKEEQGIHSRWQRGHKMHSNADPSFIHFDMMEKTTFPYKGFAALSSTAHLLKRITANL